MAVTLNARSISASYDSGGGETVMAVEYVYESTKAITNASETANEVLAVLSAVPSRPPNGKQSFNLRDCSVNVEPGAKKLYIASASYGDKTDGENLSSGSGLEGGEGGGGRGPCLPKDTETVTSIRAMKDYPITNKCKMPILPTPQIEVTLLQRSKVSYHMWSDTAAAQNELMDMVGNIDQNETNNQNAALGIDMQDANHCPPDPGAPPMPDANDVIDEANRPCGSLLDSGSIGSPQQGPCGSYFAVTKNFIDGNFSAPGIAQVGYTNCGSEGSAAHTARGPDGKIFPIVALEGLQGGGVIPWPGQPGKKK